MQIKKILFVIPDFEITGATSSLVNFLSVIDREKYDVSLFVMSHQGPGKHFFDKEKIIEENLMLSAFSGVFKKEKFSLRKIYFFIVKLLSRILRNLIPIFDIVYRHSAKTIFKNIAFDTIIAFLEGSTTDFSAHLKKSKLVAWVHCDLGRAYEKVDKIFLEKQNNIYNKFNIIICVSQFTSNTFCTLFPNLQSRVKCIYNLIDEKRIKELSKKPLKHHEYLRSYFSIISIGRIDPIKRFSEIPKIAKKLIDNNVPFKWYIVGGGNRKEEKLIKDNIVQYNCDNHVFVLGKLVNPYPYLANSDLYVSTSFSEACPMIFLEAKTLEVPIVSANFPSAYEFVSKNEGVIVPLGDMAKTIENFISNKDLYMSYKNNLGIIQYDNKSLIKELNNIF